MSFASPSHRVAGAWLCQHLWEYYALSSNRTFLARRSCPVMKEAAELSLDYPAEDRQGRLVSGPSILPENSYRLPNGGGHTNWSRARIINYWARLADADQT
jgi:hypothetical protein